MSRDSTGWLVTGQYKPSQLKVLNSMTIVVYINGKWNDGKAAKGMVACNCLTVAEETIRVITVIGWLDCVYKCSLSAAR